MAEKKYRRRTPEQKLDIVLAGLSSGRTIRDVCREHDVAEAVYYDWRERVFDGARAALATARDRHQAADADSEALRAAQGRIADLEQALGRKTLELEQALGRTGVWSSAG